MIRVAKKSRMEHQNPISEPMPSVPAKRLVRFTDCFLSQGDALIRKDLWVLDGAIVDPMKRWWDSKASSEFLEAQVVFCGGNILAPGFYDIQINGCFGVDFACPEDVTAEKLAMAARALLAHGVVAFLPTIISSSAETYRKLIPRHNAVRRLLNDSTVNEITCANTGLESNSTSATTTAGREAQDVTSSLPPPGLTSLPRARILGLHLEGPFMNAKKKGAHDAANLKQPTNGFASLLEVYGTLDGVRLVTLAPELDGALEATAALARMPNGLDGEGGGDEDTLWGDSSVGRQEAALCSSSSGTVNKNEVREAMEEHSEKNDDQSERDPGASDQQRHHGNHRRQGGRVVVSMGHTLATFEQGCAAVKSGARLVTHLFNAMPAFHHRDPGLVGLLGAPERCRPHYSIIADGLHAHPASVKLASCAHPQGAVLITDAMGALGLPDGTHTLGNSRVTVRGIRATLEGSDDTLAGAVVSMADCVRNFMRFTQCSASEAIQAASGRPAALLFGEGTLVGTLKPGAPADLVLLGTHDLAVLKVFRNGHLAWPSPV
mmetsp:Transcript_31162/g.63214  ORF Transcript_31162/g.63214 Transcript_31162/m.63214 type:complete len:548 (+) Transcript_31162:111-1754(+)